MGLILQASIHGYNRHALISATTGGLLLIGLRRLNRRMIENTNPLFKNQSTSRSAVYSVRLSFFSLWFWLDFFLDSWLKVVRKSGWKSSWERGSLNAAGKMRWKHSAGSTLLYIHSIYVSISCFYCFSRNVWSFPVPYQSLINE